MFADTVNKITFDFTCASETMATGLQREIFNYTIPQINAVVERVLNENDATDLMQINKIEIDLGVINIKELENSILNEFKELFDRELKKNRKVSDENKRKESAGFNGTSTTFNRINFDLSQSTSGLNSGSLSLPDAQIEVVRQFLLYGDLPWWIDKNSLPDLDKMMQGLINSEPGATKIFLEHISKNKQVITRLKSQFSATTLRLVNASIPGIADSAYFNIGAFASPPQKSEHHTLDREFTMQPGLNSEVKINYFFDPDAKSPGDIALNKTAAEHVSSIDELITPPFFNSGLKALRKALKKEQDENRDLKAVMIGGLIQNLNGTSFYKIKMMGFLSTYEIAAINAYLNNDKKETLQLLNIINILQKLTFFQLEFLLHVSAQGHSEVIHVELQQHPQLLKTKTNEEDNFIKDKRIKQLLKKLQGDEVTLSDELYNYSDEGLAQIEKLFKQYSLKNIIKNRLAIFLARHPHFIAYNLLQLPVKILTNIDPLSADKFLIKELKKYKAGLENVLKKFPIEYALIMEDVFTKRANATEFEIKAIINLLQKLPVDSLRIISKFALLNEDELEAFVQYNNSPEKSATPQNLLPAELAVPFKEEARKIIIENAGLCLVAIYLPRLFANLGYIENKDFKSKIYRNRALRLLEYIATGGQKAPEYVLQLNKLLCGLQVTNSISGHQRLTDKEKTEADDLISSVIANWRSVAGTSINGFRTSFIQRKGLLTESEEFWTLQVEKKGYDILIDSIPWSFNLIKLPWMKKRIHVEW